MKFIKWLISKLEFISKEEVALLFESKRQQQAEFWEEYRKIFEDI